MHESSSNKTIAKNTLFLYFRMMFTVIVSLYTSRVILNILGVNDFGVYQVVGGIVVMLSFVNGALSVGTSRFLTYELGTNDIEKLKRTFSTVLTIHIVLAVLIIILAETLGLWFVCNKLVIAHERIEAAVFAYHLSILTAIITITQVPYNASIISHERMSIYAYTSIVEVSLKLAIVYLLTIGSFDKLELYALLLCVLQIGIALFYRIYCVKNFEETHYRFILDKSIMKSVMHYSGWNLIANAAIALNTQGMTVLINMFFSPSVVAARVIANQVNMAAFQFVNNFRTAVNPQIVKRHAAGDENGSKELMLNSTKYSYYLMLALCVPIVLVAEQLLHFWLGIIPEYAVPFLQLSVITSLFQVFDISFYTALYAKGQIKENALLSPLMLFLVFPIVYFAFKLGASPIILAWASVVVYAILGLIIKPILIIRIAHYTWSDIISVFKPCLKVTLLAIPLPVLFYYYRLFLFKENAVSTFLFLSIFSFFCVLISIWSFGLERELKKKIVNTIKEKVSK